MALPSPELFTIVGAGGCVLGAGLADDVLVDLAPLVFIGAPGIKQIQGKCFH